MNQPLWDTHAHLVDDTYESDLEEVLERARDQGVRNIVVIGYTATTSRRAVDLAHRYSLWAAVGLHPNYLGNVTGADWDEIVRLLEDQPKVVAIGETGLDGYRDLVPLEVQKEWFARHLQLAALLHKPVVIHCRNAGSALLDVLHSVHPLPQLIMHAFGEDARVLREVLELGAYVSFAGNITYRNRKFDALRALVPLVPDQRLLIETDAPYLAPEPMRGKRNEPAYLVHTLRRMAELRGTDEQSLRAAIARNASRVFGLDSLR